MKSWTQKDIPVQIGKVAIVTGANSGLGFITARELARAGARVVIACRDTGKGNAARNNVLREVPQADIAVERLDLANLDSVRAFAKSQKHNIDILINNAGVMALPRSLTSDGFEMQFGTNHLGHFALTGLLLPRISAGGRIVTMSSGFHWMGRMQWDDLQGQRHYDRWSAYCQSKLANLLFMFGLQKRLENAGRDTASVGAHPGYAATNLQSRAAAAKGSGIEAMVRHAEGQMLRLMNTLVAQTDVMGALPELYAATMPGLPSGSYVGPNSLGEIRGYPTLVRPARQAANRASSDRLWQISEELTGVHYEF